MSRYATLQDKQRLKLPLKPFAKNRQHQRYRLASPALEQTCVVQLYHGTTWLQQQLPRLQQLVEMRPTVGAFPLDLVVDEQGRTVGVLLPAVQGQSITTVLVSRTTEQRALLAYQVLLLAARLEQETAPLILQASQFFVDGDQAPTWHWNETALPINTGQRSNYTALLAVLWPSLSLNNQVAPPTTAVEAAALLLYQWPLDLAQTVLQQTQHLPAPLAEMRLGIPNITPLDSTNLLGACAAGTVAWPSLQKKNTDLSPHPLVRFLETTTWLFWTGLLLFGLSAAVWFVALPALQQAYAQAYYALIGAWLVGGVLLFGLCLIVGSYGMLKAARWSSREIQRYFVSAFYKSHPNLLRAGQEGTTSQIWAQYKAQQRYLKEKSAVLEQEGQALHRAIQQCQHWMIQIRTQANRQLERAYEHYRAAHWQTAQAQQQQLVQALEQPAALVLQLEQAPQQTAIRTLEAGYKEQIAHIQERYWLVQSEQQQQWQQYKRDLQDLQGQVADWKIGYGAHFQQVAAIAPLAQAWTLEDYRAQL